MMIRRALHTCTALLQAVPKQAMPPLAVLPNPASEGTAVAGCLPNAEPNSSPEACVFVWA